MTTSDTSVQSRTFHYRGDVEVRLDKILLELIETQAQDLPGTSRSQLKQWIENGLVHINGVLSTKAGATVKPDSEIVVMLPKRESGHIEPHYLALDVLYEDDWVLFLNKPAGLVVHPGAGNRGGTLLNALAAYFGEKASFTANSRPWIVHRIDKDTSGILVIAKDEESHRKLSKEFAERRVKKMYHALSLSSPRGRSDLDRDDKGTIRTNLGRHPHERTKMAVMFERGREAVTHWKVVERLGYANLLSVQIDTGRTHQIRVHLDYMKAPVLGDPLYGDFTSLPQALRRVQADFNRQALHASSIEITHPQTGEALSLTAPLGEDFINLVAQFRDYQPA